MSSVRYRTEKTLARNLGAIEALSTRERKSKTNRPQFPALCRVLF